MVLFRVDRQACQRDGACADVCPTRIIHFQKGRYPRLIAGGENTCIECGHCVAVCPAGAIDHRAMSADNCPPVQEELLPSAEQCAHFFRYRRSVRAYREKPVPRDELERLIRMARYAPSGRNTQGAEWLVLGQKEEIRRIADVVADWMCWSIQRTPELAAAMHLERILGQWEKGRDVIFREAPVLVVVHIEETNVRAKATSTIALTYLELAAASLRLGACWAGYFMKAAEEYPPLHKELGLPQGHRSFGAMMLGYPKYRYQRLPLRNEPQITWRM